MEAIRAELHEAIGDRIVGIRRVGNTSASVLSAKPCIDLDVIIEDASAFSVVAVDLCCIGNYHEGNLGIEGSEAFGTSDKPHPMSHHLYVCTKDPEELRRHITFRDFLRRNPQAAREYGVVKETAAKLFPIR